MKTVSASSFVFATPGTAENVTAKTLSPPGIKSAPCCFSSSKKADRLFAYAFNSVYLKLYNGVTCDRSHLSLTSSDSWSGSMSFCRRKQKRQVFHWTWSTSGALVYDCYFNFSDDIPCTYADLLNIWPPPDCWNTRSCQHPGGEEGSLCCVECSTRTSSWETMSGGCYSRIRITVDTKHGGYNNFACTCVCCCCRKHFTNGSVNITRMTVLLLTFHSSHNPAKCHGYKINCIWFYLVRPQQQNELAWKGYAMLAYVAVRRLCIVCGHF